MRRSFTRAALLAAVLCSIHREPMPAAPTSRPKPPTVDEVRKRLFGTCWYETGKVVAGKEDAREPLGWKFGADETENWQITGELVTSHMSGGVTVDVSGDVWRMDILSTGERGRVSAERGAAPERDERNR